MKQLKQTTLNKLKAFILNDQDFRTYYQSARQLKNLNGFKAFIDQWLNHYNYGGYIALLDKRYLDCSYVIINKNIIDLDSLYLDFKSDTRSYFDLNPTSL